MELVQSLENHWLACMAAAGGGARVTRMAGGVVVANPRVPGLAFNFIALRGVQPARLEAALEVGGALLAASERPPAVFLTPAAGNRAELAAALGESGWRRRLRQSVLVRPLTLADRFDHPATSGVAVEPVTADNISLWSHTLVSAYEVDPITAEHLTAAWESLLTAPGEGARALGCLARLGGRPAGTGLLWMRGGIAGLYCGAVMPSLRRQGIHRATTLYRLSAAAAAGCTHATLQTEAGSPVERLCIGELGFTCAYEQELWTPPQSEPRLHCE